MPSSVIKNGASFHREGSDMKNTDCLLAAQLQATSQNVNLAKSKENAAARSAKANVAQTKTTTVKTEAPSRASKSSYSKSAAKLTPSRGPDKSESKKYSSNRVSSKKPSRRGGDPSDSDPDAGSSDDDSSSEHSDSSIDDVPTKQAMSTTTQGGSTVMTFRPYVNSSTLEDSTKRHPCLIVYAGESVSSTCPFGVAGQTR